MHFVIKVWADKAGTPHYSVIAVRAFKQGRGFQTLSVVVGPIQGGYVRALELACIRTGLLSPDEETPAYLENFLAKSEVTWTLHKVPRKRDLLEQLG